MKTSWLRTRLLHLGALSALTTLLLLGFLLSPAADHRAGPIFGPPGVNGAGGISQSRRDINDIFVFRSPNNPNNTVLVFTVSPFSTVNTPTVFDHRITYDFNIINQNILGATDDVQLRVTFAAPDAQGNQQVILRGFPAAKFKPPTFAFPNPDPILAQGLTGRNLPLDPRVGGQFRAAEQDDPFFFDAVGFARLLNPFPQGTMPPPPTPLPRGAEARDFTGPDVNTLCLTVELPSRFLTRPGSNLIGVWVATNFKGTQIDRMGRPAINAAVIPPVPRGSNFPVDNSAPNRRERRNAFNAGHPRNDRRDFKADVVAVLQNFYMRNATEANNIANLLLPDILIHDVTSTAGFGTTLPGGLLGNGRRLRDDTLDVELNLLTNGAITGDNIPDDNPGAPTAPVNPIQPNFPYIGARNANPVGLPREGQPAPGQ